MYRSKRLRRLGMAALVCTLTFVFTGPENTGYGQQAHSFDATSRQTTTLEHEVHANMNFLADDELHGRGSATRDEHIAALFVAAQLQALGLDPGGEDGTFPQKCALPDPLPERVQKQLSGFQDVPRRATWNAIGMLRGSAAPNEVILLTAH